ncbi:DUF6199 family natural product biosynthesis protein [Bacillus horti]|uniref:DUF6199 domain-containing protein n=1 Tax=Caldalkalibacillus horti TaxID=77523 RepID=A0ABT9VYQ9_9BACI|nr:DUF6199 family natural product biosynthesis protein [Bacillus horti]MDQ0166131.1 hypothetical protein [Bacillus horti]
MWLFIIVLFVLGLIGAIYPKASWFISNWWRFQGEAEPSQVSLFVHRITGLVFLVVSISMFFQR